MTSDPYAPHLRQADDLFARGDIVKAGQIWQAILKQQPTHAEARERLVAVKQRLMALREAEAVASQAIPEIPAASTPEAVPVSAAIQARPEVPAEPTPAPAPPPEPEPVAPPIPVAVAAQDPPEVPAPPASELVPESAPFWEPTTIPSPVPVMAEWPATPPEEALVSPPPARVITGSLDPDRLITEGCTLYDMGQIEDALRKWEQVLALAPEHALARGYANGARRELGLTPLLPQADPAPAPMAAPIADEDAEKLLREAVQLYDMGLVEEAISKWERALVQEPQRQEIEGYLKMARAELSHRPTPAAAPAPAPTDLSEAGALDLKLRQAEHLLILQRHEEAAFTFQQALRLSPGDARALQGLERCRKPSGPAKDAVVVPRPSTPVMALDSQGRIAMADEDFRPAPTDGMGIQPPAALLQAAPAPRKGLSLPDRFRDATEQLPWLKNPKVLAALGGGALVLIVGVALVQSHRKDQALKEEVHAARAAAMAPAAQQSQAPDLTESIESLREEAETALALDPLRAFLRAETLVNRNPRDAAGAQLLEKARAGLPGGVSGSSLAEFQKHLQNGDLEAALKVMDALLRAQPGEADLRARAGRLHLALCAAHAGQAKWDEAHEDLLRGRALFPGDKTWQIRLRLLDHVKTLPKAHQATWIPLLG